jgi:amidase
MARRVQDVRLGLRAMAAADRRDPQWVPVPLEESQEAGTKVAMVVDPAGKGVSPQVAEGVSKAGKILLDAGLSVEEIEPPGIEDAAQIWRVICLSELLTQLQPAVEEICGDRLSRTFEYYRAALPELSLDNYIRAFGQRRKVLRDWLEFFTRYDLIIAPVGTQPPLPSDADVQSLEQTLASIDSFRMTVAINALSLPAAVVPVGLAGGLPQVVQIIGPPFAEMRCLAAAELIEREIEPLTPIDPPEPEA